MTEPVMYVPGRFRKEPVEVEAMRYRPPSMFDENSAGNAGALAEWVDDGTGRVLRPTEFWGNAGHPQCWALYITTLEDGQEDGAQVQHIASPGDWIVKGVQGEFYPVRPDIFAVTYRRVDQ